MKIKIRSIVTSFIALFISFVIAILNLGRFNGNLSFFFFGAILTSFIFLVGKLFDERG